MCVSRINYTDTFSLFNQVLMLTAVYRAVKNNLDWFYKFNIISSAFNNITLQQKC